MRATIGRDSAGRRGLTLIEVVVILGIVVVLIALLLPLSRGSREAARRAQCVNNLRLLALGLWNYQEAHAKALPPAWTLDAAERPSHDWRTLILPHIDERSLYHSINLAVPWDDPANRTARDSRVLAFVCPGSPAPRTTTSTTYLATLEPSGCLVPGRPRPLDEVTDGMTNTLVAIEAGEDRAVPWVAPRDADEAVLLGLATAKLHHPRGTNAAFLDGHVWFLRADTPPRILRALATVDGGETIDPNSY